MRYRTLCLALLLTTASMGCGERSSRNSPVGSFEQPVVTTQITEPEGPSPFEPSDDGATIVRKSIEASGGAEMIARWNVGRLKYKMKGQLLQPFPPNTEPILEESFQLPGRLKRQVWATVTGEELMWLWVFKDGKGWSRHRGESLQEFETKEAERKAHRLAVFLDLGPILEKDVTLAVIAGQSVEGRPTVGVHANSEEIETDFFFDQRTGLFVKSKKMIRHPATGKIVDTEFSLSDYKEIQGGKVPMKIRSYFEGKLAIEIQFIEVQFLDKVDESEFAKPKP